MTHATWPRRVGWITAALVAVAGLVWALVPGPLAVETARATRGPLTAVVSAEGRTRVRALYVVTAPVDGDLERITLQPGDIVSVETAVARIRPFVPRPLDARARAEATFGIEAARAAVRRADATEAEARVSLEHVQSKLTRVQTLVASSSMPSAELEHGGHELEIARRSGEAARAAALQARAELARASAIVAPPSSRPDGGPGIVVQPPSPGRVLRVLRESGGPIAAGTPLMEVGDLASLEVLAELLSSDAASVRPGAAATLSGWGGPRALASRVRRVDPAGYTKISALGLEEQRVHVVLDFAEPIPAGVGHDYRLDVAIVAWHGDDVLRVPSTAPFRAGSRWAVFVLQDGRAHLTQVELGPSDEASTVVTSGLPEGAEVVAQPSDSILDGVRVGALTR